MPSKLLLKPHPLLVDFQKYVQELVEERGFKNTLSDKFMLFLEECGELAKAARKYAQLKTDSAKVQDQNAAFEAADVFIFLLDICNDLHIDLEKAFREKEEINKQRQWQ